jgi:hypothetical protein
MNRLLKTTILASIAIVSSLMMGCKKKCDLGDNVTSGEIKTGVSIFPRSGYMFGPNPDLYLITGSHSYANEFKISFDQGKTKVDVNYNEYSILTYPLTVSCFAQFTRDVTIDDVNGIVKYTIKVKECGKCEEERTVENYVVIRHVPDYYTVLYDVDIQTVD